MILFFISKQREAPSCFSRLSAAGTIIQENYPDNVIEEISRIPLVNAVSCEDLKIAMARVEGGS